MVLVGHSMGGLLSKMMAQDSGRVLWDSTIRIPYEQFKFSPQLRDCVLKLGDHVVLCRGHVSSRLARTGERRMPAHSQGSRRSPLLQLVAHETRGSRLLAVAGLKATLAIPSGNA